MTTDHLMQRFDRECPEATVAMRELVRGLLIDCEREVCRQIEDGVKKRLHKTPSPRL